MQPGKKLYRSRTNRVIAGVCAGLADYFNIDVTIMRVIFVAGSLFAGTFVLIYIALFLLVPEEPI